MPRRRLLLALLLLAGDLALAVPTAAPGGAATEQRNCSYHRAYGDYIGATGMTCRRVRALLAGRDGGEGVTARAYRLAEQERYPFRYRAFRCRTLHDDDYLKGIVCRHVDRPQKKRFRTLFD